MRAVAGYVSALQGRTANERLGCGAAAYVSGCWPIGWLLQRYHSCDRYAQTAAAGPRLRVKPSNMLKLWRVCMLISKQSVMRAWVMRASMLWQPLNSWRLPSREHSGCALVICPGRTSNVFTSALLCRAP